MDPDLQPIKILIADDHPIVREGLVAVLNAQSDMEVVGEAETGTQAVAALNVTESTVKYHIGLIFSKLRVNARTEAATAVLKRGIVSLD